VTTENLFGSLNSPVRPLGQPGEKQFPLSVLTREAKSSDKQGGSDLRAGDLVAVRTADQILRTLDSDGTLDGLPFMPEMLEFCGKRFRVFHHVVQAAIDGAYLPFRPDSYVRAFKKNDVVSLHGVRCSGSNHDGCQRGCAIFWKTDWLEKAGVASKTEGEPRSAGADELRSTLKTRTAVGNYFCQSSEFLNATLPLSVLQRFRNCFSAIAAGNISAWGMVKRVMRWSCWKIRTKLFGEHARGTQTKTPTQNLGLQPGELVEIKSIPQIVTTLDKRGRNRGLHFSGDQRAFCGGRYRVRSRVDNFITEGTGEMKHFRNSVILEDVTCDSAYFAFGGCYRCDFLYWHEIWLRRVESRPD
jgi:hypothetical protein